MTEPQCWFIDYHGDRCKNGVREESNPWVCEDHTTKLCWCGQQAFFECGNGTLAAPCLQPTCFTHARWCHHHTSEGRVRYIREIAFPRNLEESHVES